MDSLTSQTFMRSPINEVLNSKEKKMNFLPFHLLTFDRSRPFHGNVPRPSTWNFGTESWSVKSAHFVALLEQISSDSVDWLIWYRISSGGGAAGTAQKSRHFEFYRRLLVPVLVMGVAKRAWRVIRKPHKNLRVALKSRKMQICFGLNWSEPEFFASKTKHFFFGRITSEGYNKSE